MNESNFIKELKSEVRNRLQFVIVLALFFPVPLEALFKLGPTNFNSDKIILEWGLVILVLIIIYLLLEAVKTRMSIWFVKLIDALLLLEIAMFIPVLLVFAELALKDYISIAYAIPFKISLFGLLADPLLLLLILGIYWIKLIVDGIVPDRDK